jgi:hypothetical protein
MYSFWSVPAAEGTIAHQTGGSLASAADGTVYTFSSTSLAADVRLRHVPVMPANIPAMSKVGIGHAFVVSATDTANDRPLVALPAGQTYKLEVTYTPQELNGVNEATLSFYYWNGSTWVKQTTTVNPTTHKLTTLTNRFGLWTVMTGNLNVFLPILRR